MICFQKKIFIFNLIIKFFQYNKKVLNSLKLIRRKFFLIKLLIISIYLDDLISYLYL